MSKTVQQKERPCPKSNIYENLGFLWLKTAQYSRTVEQGDLT